MEVFGPPANIWGGVVGGGIGSWVETVIDNQQKFSLLITAIGCGALKT